jgi:uncharacterized protein (DUF2141 family)
MKPALYLAAALALQAQTQPIPQDPDKARLEGIVLNSATGEPLRKTRLTLRMNVAAVKDQRAPQPPQSVYTVTSDPSGKFEIANIEPGDYQLAAVHDGFGTLHLGNQGNGKKVEPILLARADRKTNFTIKLVPYGVIAGVVLDEDGDPIRNLHISAMAWRYGSNGRELREEKSAESNDAGEYRIFDLPPGRYLVKINPRALRFDGGRDENSYGSVFYPGVPQVSGAIPQDVAPGQQLRGLTFNLRKVHVASIRGKIIAPPDATGLSCGILIATDGGSSSTSTNVNDSKTGKFELNGVAPGSIYVTGSYVSAGQSYSTVLPVEVGESDIEGLELRPLPPTDLTGQISVEGDPAFDVTKIGISLDGAYSGHRSETPPSIAKDGRLVIHGVLPGRYRISLSRLQQLYIKSIRWGTTDVTDGPLDLLGGIPPRMELAIVLGADAAELTGSVANSNAEPVEAATVTLLPAGEHRSRPFFKTAATDPAGHFTIRGIAPGSYKVFAWDQVNANAVLYDPEFLRPYEGEGQGLEIRPGGKQTADLRLIVNKEPDERSR